MAQAATQAAVEAEDAPRSQFNILEWMPAYTNCQKHFLDHAQYEPGVQAAAAFTNIRLPHQWPQPVWNSAGLGQTPASPSSARAQAQPGAAAASQQHGPARLAASGSSGAGAANGPASIISLFPYIRRLVVTGFDRPAVLEGFFGSDWQQGVGPLHDSERRNYMFHAKSGGWATVKAYYDIGPHETVPYLQPLQDVTLREITGSEQEWSRWLAMEDWMVGPRAPSAWTEGGGYADRDMDDTVEGGHT